MEKILREVKSLSTAPCQKDAIDVFEKKKEKEGKEACKTVFVLVWFASSQHTAILPCRQRVADL